jgi:hypothetical protein
MNTEPVLTIPLNYNQSADAAVLSYVSQRMDKVDVVTILTPGTYDVDSFLTFVSQVYKDLMLKGEKVIIERVGNHGEMRVEIIKPDGKTHAYGDEILNK